MLKADEADFGAPWHLSRLRLLSQTGFAVFTVWAGYRFFLFHRWAVGSSEHFVPRPPAVEGFLPISALLGLKQLLLTGQYDRIHPAGLTIFLAALSISLLLRKGFCGWICPVGFASNLAEKIGRRAGLLRQPPGWLDKLLLSLKYLLLVFFLYVILWRMELGAVQNFIRSPYNLAADAKMLLFFLNLSGLALGIMLFLVAISFLLRNFWCRYLCPYGAMLGLVALLSPLSLRRDEKKCINCQRCDRICPGALQVSRKTAVRSPECIGCLECVAVCPSRNCLSVAATPNRSLLPLLLPIGVLTTFLIFWGWAVSTGHWQTSLPADSFRNIYRLTGNLTHPPY